MDDNEMYLPDDDVEEFETYYYEKYGKYDLGDFQDLVRWAREFEPKNPDRMDEVERMGICIRLLSSERIGSNVGYKFMTELCGKAIDRAEKAEQGLRRASALISGGVSEMEEIEQELEKLDIYDDADDIVEMARKAVEFGSKYYGAWKIENDRLKDAEARIAELEQNIADAVADAEMFKAENARLRAALEAMYDYCDQYFGTDNENDTEIVEALMLAREALEGAP